MLNTKELVALTEYQQVGSRLVKVKTGITKIVRDWYHCRFHLPGLY